MTITEAMAMFARQMEAEGYSRETILAYTADAHHFVSSLRMMNLRDGIIHLTTENVQKWVITQTENGTGARLRNRRMSALSQLSKFLERIGKLDRDPTRLVRRAKEPKRVTRYLTAEVATRLIRAAGPTVMAFFDHSQKPQPVKIYDYRNEAIIRCFVQGGVRLGELQSLSLVNMRPDGFIVMGKRRKERVIKLAPSTMKIIEAWLGERRGGAGPEDAVFTNYIGGRLSKRGLAKVVSDAAARLGLEGVRPHLLRHTMASLLRERGVELDVIRDRLGHDSLATTERYVHAVPMGQDAAANILSDL